MRRQTSLLGTLGILGMLASGGNAQDRPAPTTASPDALGGADRYLSHVATDKPIYREKETVYVRGVVLHAATRKPLPKGAGDTYALVEVIGPKGDVVTRGGAPAPESVVAFSWKVPEGQAGGGYKVKVSFPGQGYPVGERAFEVRAFRAPRLKSQIEFLRDGYGAGADVDATLSVERAEGGYPAGAQVSMVAMVDGREVVRQPAGTVDAAGRCAVSFRLPTTIERGEGTLALVIQDGGVVETATKTIPILLSAVDLVMFPEGGALVAGLPTRVYLEARTPARKPADVAGVVEDGAGKVVARFKTEHEGRGRFEITPRAGARYRLRVTEPAGITKGHELPEVKADGGTIASVADVVPAGKPLALRAAAVAGGAHRIAVSRLEREVASQEVTLVAGQPASVEVPLPADADGVLRVTLWKKGGPPVAERLVFRTPLEQVVLSVEADRTRYVPGGAVALKVKTTRPDGRPVAAMVGISVADDSVHELLETRDQAPQLPVQVLLEDDVWELADAHVYLDPKDPSAPRAVDLLLGTQGWRRFVYVSDVKAFASKNGDRARRALALVEPQPPMAKNGFKGNVPGGVLGGAVDGMEMPKEVGAVPPVPAVAAPPPEGKPDAAAAGEEELAVDAKRPVAGPEVADGDLARMDQLAADEPVMEKQVMGRARREMAAASLAYVAGGGVTVVREYAHQVRPGRQAGERRDFAETLYWHAGIRTDAATGEAKVAFGLSDAVTKFRVLADAFTEQGALGASRSAVESVEPFYIEPKLPLEVTYGDVVKVPVSLVNGTLEPLQNVTLSAKADAPLQAGKLPAMVLKEEERARRILEITVGQKAGEASLTISGGAGAYRDEVTRTLKIAPLGFPSSQSFGGLLPAGGRVAHEVTVPADVVAGSVVAKVKVYPSSLGKLTSALERLIQEPCGCFEQTSSTTYPLVMAQQYFKSHTGVDPALVAKSHDLLGKGYERLTGFECKTKGYEWFGESPGHEALSAFGLLEFYDMSKVRAVDQAMVDRTREWLLAQRDGKGGFKRERRALHTWIEDADASNAYIVWALLRAGESKGIATEIDGVLRSARGSKNSYVVALGANVATLAGRTADVAALLDRLGKSQGESGAVGGATASIVGSTGEALDIETTALATLAWLPSAPHQGHVEKAIRYLAESCQGGRYGSTQSTVLALQAIVEYDRLRSRPKAPGSVTLRVDGKVVGTPVAFDEKSQEALPLPDVAALLTPGKHAVELAMERGSEMPYAIEVVLNALTPTSSPDCQIALEVDLSRDTLVEGEIAEATVLVRSRSKDPLPMAVAIVGIPGGLEPRHEQLKELVKSRAVAAYEVIGRDVVLYWRSLEPEGVKRVPLSLVAAVPGRYTGPASRAYLYYGDEHRVFAPGFTVEVTPR